MKKKLIAMLAILTVMVSGCSSSNGDKQAKDSESPASKEKVEITFSSWGGSAYTETNELLLKAFELKNPNIKVKIEDTPNKQYWQKMEASASGENLPDVFWMNGPRFISYAANGMLKPLDEMINADMVDMKSYPESLVKLYNYGGKQYALPKDFDTIGVWYNKALFDAKGVPYPNETWDWSKFTDAAKKLTDPAKGVWGIAAALDSQGGFYNTIYQSGGYVISDDKKTSGYDKPEAIEGLKFWTDLINVHKASPTLAQMTDTEPVDMFSSGKVAMLWEGSWNAATFGKNEYLKDKVDVAALPKNKQQSVVIHGLGYAMAAKSKHPKEAWEFVKFLGSKEAMDIQAKTGVAIPAFNGTQDTWVKSFPNMKLQIFIDQVKYSKPYPVSKYTSKWSGQEVEFLNKAWTGQVPVEEVAKQLASKMNEALASEK